MTALADSQGAAAKAVGEKVECDHCGLPVPPALVDAEADTQFCCGGCAVAYETIRGCGLADYYAIRDRFATDRQAARSRGERYASFDSDAFLARHASTTPAGWRSIDLRLDGVHCAACVWLVEKLPQIAPGVIEARLTLGSARARVVWDAERTPLSAVAGALDRLGYAPHPARDASARAARDAGERRRLVNMAIAGALAGNNMLIAIALYAGVFEGIEPQYARLFRWISMVIGWISLCGPGQTFFRSASAAIRARIANLDVPIALALAVGGVAGTVNVLMDRGEVYFDSISVLVFLLLVGRYLQSRQQRWAEDAVGLMLSLTPDACRVVRGGELVEESVESLAIEDEVEVRPGELFPADGDVVRGASSVDQSLLTGETLPIPVAAGDPVCAGAQNVGSTLRVQVSAVGESTRIGKLVRLVEDGVAAKPPIVRFADRVAGWFVLVVCSLSLLNLGWWGVTVGLEAAIDSTVALLIVACPCALGLATPLTMAVAIGRGAKQGMLIKSAAVLEQIARVRPPRRGLMFLDKTGTLTTGRLRVEAWHGDPSLQPWVAALETESNHPIAAALTAEFGPVEPSDVLLIRQRDEAHGYGVAGSTPVGELLVGSPRMGERVGIIVDCDHQDEIEGGRELGYTAVLVAMDGVARAVVWLSDQVHSDSEQRVAELRRMGWRPALLSGDAHGPVERVAAAVGVTPADAQSEADPESKLDFVRAATANDETVMMVGDGVNDAAALAAADVGVAVHGGAEASLAAADVYLTEPGIGKLTDLVRLGRATMRTAYRSLGLSLAYNALAVGLAMAGWITPLVAALLMPASSATVLASAVGLRTGRK